MQQRNIEYFLRGILKKNYHRFMKEIQTQFNSLLTLPLDNLELQMNFILMIIYKLVKVK